MDEAVVRGMFELTCNMAAEPWVFAAGRWHAAAGRGPHADPERKSSYQEPIVTSDFTPLYGDVDKLTFVSDDEPLLRGLREQALARFGGRATIVQSQTYYLDVTPLAGNKDDGLRVLADSRGIDLADTIAIGDRANDLAMLDRAGFGIVMGNAPDKVKACADAVTLSNDEDGVAHAIDTMILGKPA